MDRGELRGAHRGSQVDGELPKVVVFQDGGQPLCRTRR